MFKLFWMSISLWLEATIPSIESFSLAPETEVARKWVLQLDGSASLEIPRLCSWEIVQALSDVIHSSEESFHEMRFLNDSWWKRLLELLHTIWCIIEYPHCQWNKNSEKLQKNLCRSSEMLMDTVDVLRVTAPQYISSKRICHQGLELRCHLQIRVNHKFRSSWSFVVKCRLLVEAPRRIESHHQQARAT